MFISTNNKGIQIQEIEIEINKRIYQTYRSEMNPCNQEKIAFIHPGEPNDRDGR
jgi:hypothetical protein